MKKIAKKVLAVMLISVLGMTILSACGGSSGGENGVVYVYNWGEYIDPETIEMFEEETGIKVVYDEYETNEIMYPKVEAGAVNYDVVCPSDYMIQKMIDNDLLAKIPIRTFNITQEINNTLSNEIFESTKITKFFLETIK